MILVLDYTEENYKSQTNKFFTPGDSNKKWRKRKVVRVTVIYTYLLVSLFSARWVPRFTLFLLIAYMRVIHVVTASL